MIDQFGDRVAGEPTLKIPKQQEPLTGFEQGLQSALGITEEQFRANKVKAAENKAYYGDRFADLDLNGVDKVKEELATKRTRLDELRLKAEAQLKGFEKLKGRELSPEQQAFANSEIQNYNQRVSEIQKLADAVTRDERMAVRREYDIKKDQGSFVGATYNNILSNLGSAVSGVNAPVLNAMIAMDPPKPREGETQAQANNRLRSIMRGGMRTALNEAVGSEGTTPEYVSDMQKGFFGGAWLAATGTVPLALMGPGGLGMMASAADNTMQEMEGEEFADIPEWKKALFSSTIGVVTGQLERYGLQQAVGGGKLARSIMASAISKLPQNATTQQIKAVIEAETKSAVTNAGARIVGSMVSEGATEFQQGIAEPGLKDLFNLAEDKNLIQVGEGEKGFDTPDGLSGYVKDAMYSAAQGMVGGGIFGTPHALRSFIKDNKVGATANATQFQLMEELLADPDFDDALKEDLRVQAEAGKLTAADVRETEAAWKEAQAIVSKIPGDLDVDKRRKAFDLLTQKAKLSKMEPDLVRSKLDKIKEQLAELSNEPEPPKPTADGKTPEPRVATQEEVDGALTPPQQPEDGSTEPTVGTTDTGVAPVPAPTPTDTDPAPSVPDQGTPPAEVRPAAEVSPAYYRETSLTGLHEVIPTGRSVTELGDVHLADSPEMALGQGRNKGVLLEFDQDGIDAKENKGKPGLGVIPGASKEYMVRMGRQPVFKKALRRFTIKKDALADRVTRMQIQRALGELEESGWIKSENSEGTTWTRPDAVLPAAEVGAEPYVTRNGKFRVTQDQKTGDVKAEPVVPFTDTWDKIKDPKERKDEMRKELDRRAQARRTAMYEFGTERGVPIKLGPNAAKKAKAKKEEREQEEKQILKKAESAPDAELGVFGMVLRAFASGSKVNQDSAAAETGWRRPRAGQTIKFDKKSGTNKVVKDKPSQEEKNTAWALDKGGGMSVSSMAESMAANGPTDASGEPLFSEQDYREAIIEVLNGGFRSTRDALMALEDIIPETQEEIIKRYELEQQQAAEEGVLPEDTDAAETRVGRLTKEEYDDVRENYEAYQKELTSHEDGVPTKEEGGSDRPAAQQAGDVPSAPGARQAPSQKQRDPELDRLSDAAKQARAERDRFLADWNDRGTGLFAPEDNPSIQSSIDETIDNSQENFDAKLEPLNERVRQADKAIADYVSKAADRAQAAAQQTSIDQAPKTEGKYSIGDKVWSRGDELTVTTEPYEKFGAEWQDAVNEAGETKTLPTPRSKADQAAKDKEQRNAEQEAFARLNKPKSPAQDAPSTSLADQIRKLKIDPNITGSFIIPPQIINGAIEAVATAVEAGVELAEAIKRGVEYLRQQDWYKKLDAKGQQQADTSLESHLGPVRQFEAPNNPDPKQKKRKLTERVMADPSIDQGIKNAFTGNSANYNVLPHNISKAQANSLLAQMTDSEAEAAILDTKNGMHMATRFIMGIELMRKYNDQKDYAEAASFYDKFVPMTTEAGQGISALRELAGVLGKEALVDKAKRDMKKAADRDLTPAELKEIERLAEKVERAPKGRPKQDAMMDLNAYQANLKGVDLMEVVTAIWYANVLSGPITHLKNFVSNASNLLMAVPIAAIQRAGGKGSMRMLARGFMQGVERGALEAGAVWNTGIDPRPTHSQTPATLERVKVWAPWKYHKYVRRGMLAVDAIFFEAAKEVRAYQLAMHLAQNETGVSPSQSAKDRAMAILNRNDQVLASVQKQAKAEYDQEIKDGVSKRTAELNRKRRVFELYEDARPDEIRQESSDYGERVTYNYKPEGLLGLMAEGLNQMVDKASINGVKPLRFAIPFTNIIANVANEALNYFPITGAIRAARGTSTVFDYNKRELTPMERADMTSKAIIGTSLMIAAYMLSESGDDDEEPLMEITGNGTGDYKKNYELQETGWQPYSIKVGGKWYSYQYTPLVLALGYIGHIRDLEKYKGEKLEEEGPATKAVLAAKMTARTMLDATAMSSLNAIMKAVMNDESESNVDGVIRSALQTGSSFVVPNMYTQGAKTMESLFEIPTKEVRNSLAGRILRDIPVARNQYYDKVNALGEPVIPDQNFMISSKQSDPVWDLLERKRIFINSPSPNTAKIVDPKTDEPRLLTDQEFYEFAKERGTIIRSRIENNLDRLKYMTEEDANKTIGKYKAQATVLAKKHLYGRLTTN